MLDGEPRPTETLVMLLGTEERVLMTRGFGIAHLVVVSLVLAGSSHSRS